MDLVLNARDSLSASGIVVRRVTRHAFNAISYHVHLHQAFSGGVLSINTSSLSIASLGFDFKLNFKLKA